jgi:hypothetical protein
MYDLDCIESDWTAHQQDLSHFGPPLKWGRIQCDTDVCTLVLFMCPVIAHTRVLCLSARIAFVHHKAEYLARERRYYQMVYIIVCDRTWGSNPRPSVSHIESGRHAHTLVEDRMCIYCNSELDRRVIENEQHCLLECPLYADIRRANNLQHSHISDHTFVYILSSTDPSTRWKLFLAGNNMLEP